MDGHKLVIRFFWMRSLPLGSEKAVLTLISSESPALC